MAFWLVIGGLGLLVLVHTTRPRFRQRLISAAQFFKSLPPPRKSSPRLTLSNPFKTPALYPRLLWIGLLLAAIWVGDRRVQISGETRFNVWFLMDTSSSMTTRQDQGSFWDAAGDGLQRAISQMKRYPGGLDGRFRLSLFDLDLRDLGQGRIGDDWSSLLAGVRPRALGTDLGLLRRAIQQAAAAPGPEPLTHVVIITDQPAPAWLAGITGPAFLWQDISQPRVNLAIESLTPLRNSLTGTVTSVNIGVAAHGVQQPQIALKVIAPGSGEPTQMMVEWRNERFGHLRLETPLAGMYSVQLSQGGDYQGDDLARFEIPMAVGIRVDWQLPDQRIPQQLGWVITRQNPRFRVGSELPVDAQRPFLLVGSGLVEQASEVRDFVEASPLIADLNFDVVERFHPLARLSAKSFDIHLRDTEQGIWSAMSDHPPGAYVPGLPAGLDSPADRLLTTLFFNAVRWLLRESEPPPIYSLTTPLQPVAQGTRLNLHPGEGDTSVETRSFGEWQDLTVKAGQGQGQPWWPWLLVAATLVFVLERSLSFWGGRSWH